jgi:DNA-binding NarL/FixJ family response regulator
MTNTKLNIIIADTSQVIVEGLFSILKTKKGNINISVTDSLNGIKNLCSRAKFDLVILNPLLIQNNTQAFKSLKDELDSQPYFCAIVYAYFDPCILSFFDTQLTIGDSPDEITSKIEKLLDTPAQKENSQTVTLSERETDVLRLLVAGLPNKEIADKLNISTYTVITHRKNISHKTGIKSVSGLTIYAVVQNIISIENLKE